MRDHRTWTRDWPLMPALRAEGLLTGQAASSHSFRKPALTIPFLKAVQAQQRRTTQIDQTTPGDAEAAFKQGRKGRDSICHIAGMVRWTMELY